MIYVYIENKNFQLEIKYAVKCLFRIMNVHFHFIDWGEDTLSLLKSDDLVLYYGKNYQNLKIDQLQCSFLGIMASGQLFGENYKTEKSLPKKPLVTKEYISLYYSETMEEFFGFEVLSQDILSDVYFMLSRYEEYIYVSQGRVDCYNRFLGEDSISFQFSFLDRPVVDEWAVYLRYKMKKKGCAMKLVDAERKSKLLVTHDIDHLYYYANYKQRIWDWCCGKSGNSVLWKRDPYFNIRFLAEWECHHGIKSDYYLIPVQGNKDADYSINMVRLKREIHEIYAMGHEIGYHASFYTASSMEKYQLELKKIREVFPDIKIRGMRSHYLKSNVPATYRAVNGKIFYDTTLAFPDHEGFRCGTCHPFPVFDLEKREELTVWEIPLIFMDVTLKGYRYYSAGTVKEKFIQYAKTIQKHQGVMNILWHNNRFGDPEWEKYNKIYLSYVLHMSKLWESMNGYEIMKLYQDMDRRLELNGK